MAKRENITARMRRADIRSTALAAVSGIGTDRISRWLASKENWREEQVERLEAALRGIEALVTATERQFGLRPDLRDQRLPEAVANFREEVDAQQWLEQQRQRTAWENR
jgi:hypothetical protein